MTIRRRMGEALQAVREAFAPAPLRPSLDEVLRLVRDRFHYWREPGRTPRLPIRECEAHAFRKRFGVEMSEPEWAVYTAEWVRLLATYGGGSTGRLGVPRWKRRINYFTGRSDEKP